MASDATVYRVIKLLERELKEHGNGTLHLYTVADGKTEGEPFAFGFFALYRDGEIARQLELADGIRNTSGTCD